ncbi:MAG TPA: hypothetical protein VGR61_11790, partial [Candidatus Dormibacteraeota bacterium]|nr:hypothetical protein [Candidatus Dormibacteraeota bacterium]
TSTARWSAAPAWSPRISSRSSTPPSPPRRSAAMAYGNSTPPDGAPVPPQELIGAALFVGLVAVVSISRHGAYLIGLLVGRFPLDAAQLLLLVISTGGFAASLWLLALRRWAWQGAVAYAVVEICLRGYYLFAYLAPGMAGRPGGRVDPLGALGELLFGLLFLVVLGFLLGEETRGLLDARERYRAEAAG